MEEIKMSTDKYILTLPNDYARCQNKNCPLSKTCLRFTDKGTNKYMWYSDPDMQHVAKIIDEYLK